MIKSEKGVTLMELTVYIIVLLIVMGILTTISQYFYGNLSVVRYSAKYAAEFDKFNSYFVSDAKKNTSVKVYTDTNTDTNNLITFEDGTTYKYNEDDKSIYRGQVRIATNVKSFNASKRTITVSGVKKEIVTITILIGNSERSIIGKNIDYTLKYW